MLDERKMGQRKIGTDSKKPRELSEIEHRERLWYPADPDRRDQRESAKALLAMIDPLPSDESLKDILKTCPYRLAKRATERLKKRARADPRFARLIGQRTPKALLDGQYLIHVRAKAKDVFDDVLHKLVTEMQAKFRRKRMMLPHLRRRQDMP